MERGCITAWRRGLEGGSSPLVQRMTEGPSGSAAGNQSAAPMQPDRRAPGSKPRSCEQVSVAPHVMEIIKVVKQEYVFLVSSLCDGC
jgi:hypothetical protein